jgi:hypothetical protein
VGKGYGQYAVVVLEATRCRENPAAVAERAAALFVCGALGVDVLGAAAALDGDAVEPGADVLGREFVELLGAQGGDDVHVEGLPVVGEGVGAHPVRGDVRDPVFEVGGEGALVDGGAGSVLVLGDGLDQCLVGLLPGAAVDAYTGAAAVEGFDPGGAFVAAVFAGVDGACAVGASVAHCLESFVFDGGDQVIEGGVGDPAGAADGEGG